MKALVKATEAVGYEYKDVDMSEPNGWHFGKISDRLFQLICSFDRTIEKMKKVE